MLEIVLMLQNLMKNKTTINMKTLITFLLFTFSLTTFSQNQIEFDETNLQIESIRKKSKEIEQMTKEMDLIFLENKIMIIERKVSELEEKVNVQNRTLKENNSNEDYSLLYVGFIIFIIGGLSTFYNFIINKTTFNLYSFLFMFIGLLIMVIFGC